MFDTLNCAGFQIFIIDQTRGFFFLSSREVPIPDWLRQGLRYAPLAAMAAVVVPRPGAELALEELNEFLRAKKIASFKLPEHLEIRDVLPRNEVGKILKRELRK